ncbi:MAG: type II secretion system protein J [Gemmatimonadales bacterium]
MSSRQRSRGFTLIEIMIAMVLMTLVATVIYQMLITTQRVTDAQAERGDLQSNLRSGILVVPNELRQLTLGTSSTLDTISDIRAITDTSITYRVMRGFYTVCAVPANATTIIVYSTSPSAYAAEYRAPVTTDSLMLFWEGDSTVITDDRWIPLPITAIHAASTSCVFPWSATTHPGYTLTLGSTGVPTALGFAKVYAGAPVRTYEIDTLRLMSFNSQQWLGMSASGGAVQPMAGPLAPTAGSVYGFQLTYYDSTGAALTASSTNIPKVRSIRIAIRGISQDPVAQAGRTRAVIQDSLVTYITPRNTPLN